MKKIKNFAEISRVSWNEPIPKNLVKVWENNRFLVQRYHEEHSIRLTVIKKEAAYFENGLPIWKEGITWDELQGIKDALGFYDSWFVEIYPPKEHIINVANMRHLWIITEPNFGWKKEKEKDEEKRKD